VADYTITVTTYTEYEPGLGRVWFTSTSHPNGITINPNDRIRILHQRDAYSDATGLQLFANSWFTPTDTTLAGSPEYSSWETATSTGSISLQFRPYYSRTSGPDVYVSVNVEVPYIQYTGALNMNDIGTFLGDPNPKGMLDWYRGGNPGGVYVPNIPDGRNNGIPTYSITSSTTISLSMFSGVWKNG
jgi:hypothetical protein